jgi:hypothetical protein
MLCSMLEAQRYREVLRQLGGIMIDTRDICTDCGLLTIDGTDPAWYYGKDLQLKMTFITHNCKGE